MAKKPAHRPSIEIDFNQLTVLMRFKPTQADAAAYFKCSEDTIARRIEKETGLTYAEFREQNMVHTRMTLVQTALKKANGGDNVMLIFCLKNLCGWKDKTETDVIVNNITGKSDAEINERIETLYKKAKGESGDE